MAELEATGHRYNRRKKPCSFCNINCFSGMNCLTISWFFIKGMTTHCWICLIRHLVSHSSRYTVNLHIVRGLDQITVNITLQSRETMISVVLKTTRKTKHKQETSQHWWYAIANEILPCILFIVMLGSRISAFRQFFIWLMSMHGIFIILLTSLETSGCMHIWLECRKESF